MTKHALLAIVLLGGIAGCSPISTAEPSPEETIDRYVAVALSCEYAECPEGIVRPSRPVSVQLRGPYRDDQLFALEAALSQWNSACPIIPLEMGGQSGVVMDFYFVDEPRMADVLAVHVPGNVGLFNYDWDGSNSITGMTVAIANEISGKEMEHFVLEETTQAMGLINDVADPQSIFDAGRGRAVAYSPLDAAVIAFHCREDVSPGMLRDELPL